MIIWRRHVTPCESTDHSDTKCGCPIYQEYRVSGKRLRRSLKTRNWQKALAEARRKELERLQGKTEVTRNRTGLRQVLGRSQGQGLARTDDL